MPDTASKNKDIRPLILDYQEIKAIKAGDKHQHRIISDSDEPYLKVGDLLRVDDKTVVELIELRHEFVQDICVDDVLQSGLPDNSDTNDDTFYWVRYSPAMRGMNMYGLLDHKAAYEAYWVDKHGEGAWDNNHRVWVLTFVLVEPELELDQVRVDENAEFMLINGTKFDLLKCPDSRLLLTTTDYLSQERHHDKMLECEALRLRDWLLAMYPL